MVVAFVPPSLVLVPPRSLLSRSKLLFGRLSPLLLPPATPLQQSPLRWIIVLLFLLSAIILLTKPDARSRVNRCRRPSPSLQIRIDRPQASTSHSAIIGPRCSEAAGSSCRERSFRSRTGSGCSKPKDAWQSRSLTFKEQCQPQVEQDAGPRQSLSSSRI